MHAFTVAMLHRDARFYHRHAAQITGSRRHRVSFTSGYNTLDRVDILTAQSTRIE